MGRSITYNPVDEGTPGAIAVKQPSGATWYELGSWTDGDGNLTVPPQNQVAQPPADQIITRPVANPIAAGPEVVAAPPTRPVANPIAAGPEVVAAPPAPTTVLTLPGESFSTQTDPVTSDPGATIGWGSRSILPLPGGDPTITAPVDTTPITTPPALPPISSTVLPYPTTTPLITGPVLTGPAVDAASPANAVAAAPTPIESLIQAILGTGQNAYGSQGYDHSGTGPPGSVAGLQAIQPTQGQASASSGSPWLLIIGLLAVGGAIYYFYHSHHKAKGQPTE